MNKLIYILFSILIPVFYINTAAAVIEGTITDSKTGQQISGVNILFTTNPESSVPLGYNYKTITDSSGYYKISDVKPGVYVIIAEHKNYETNTPEKLLVPDSAGMVIEYNFSLNPLNNTGYKYGKISGRVTYDNDGLPVLGAYVTAMPADSEIMIEPWLGVEKASADSMGYYTLRVPEGKYKVLCYLFNYAGYYQEYYDNTENINEAVIVNVPADSVTAGINFGVPLLPPDTAVVSFSGKVTDNTGTPLAKAYVRIELPGIYTGVIASPPDMGAATDENGFYKISFPLNKAFFAKKYIVIAQKEGYDIEFYKDKKNYYEADILYYDCTGIFKNINFSLDPVKPEKFYSISGKITDDKGAPVISGMVIGLDEISRNFYYALSDSAGFYSLTGLTSGKYYILFLAKGYVPEFYNNASRWEDASVIAADKDISNIDAALNRISPVDADSSFIILSGYIKSGDTPLPGVLVTVSNSLNEVIAYDITNASGEYRIEGLTKGSYNLQASLVNYSSKNEGLECRTSSGMQTVNFSMSPAAPTSVKEKTKILPLKTDLLPNYPNPFNPSTVITFDLSKTENTELKVYNIIGQEVATLINGRLNAGTYNIPFEAKGLGSGVYLYQLKTGSASIVKKMILTR